MLILVAGSKSGKVGIWDLNNADTNDGLYSWSVHTRPVSNLLFATASPHLLYSCSFDGVLRSLDLQHQTFQKALMSSSSMSLSSFDFQDIEMFYVITRATKSQYGQFFLPAQNAMKQAQNKFQLCTTCGIEVIRSDKVKMLR
ncbi:unnamed protein product [Clavelina lepadiformis]|uniref:Uncharacterized protein n=1 Tax=Clavelina lepadiformis TaxID=159417 RepID=A0ABP0FQZ6_CLALP